MKPVQEDWQVAWLISGWLMASAINSGATAMILAHNHPSGSLKPSQPDERLTRNVRLAGELMDIKLVDHLIVTGEGYYSFADEGQL
jgi:DNA repair protein RadC